MPADEQIQIGVINQQLIDLRADMQSGFQQLNAALAETAKQNADTSQQLALAVLESSKNHEAVGTRFDTVERSLDETRTLAEGNGARLDPVERFIDRFKAQVAIVGGVVSLAWLLGSFWYVNVYLPQREASAVTEAVVDTQTEILKLLQEEFAPDEQN